MAVTVSYTLTRADVLRFSWMSLCSRPFVLALGVGFFIVLPWAFAVWQIIDAVRGIQHASNWRIAELLLIPPLAVVAFAAIPLWLSRGSRAIGAKITRVCG